MFDVQVLTHDGWLNRAQHDSRDVAFSHARAASDAEGGTYRLIRREQHMLCLMTSHGSECWELD